jgi:hypothetical protein
MKKSVMYRTIVSALAVGLACVPVATDAIAAGHGGGTSDRDGGGHFGGGFPNHRFFWPGGHQGGDGGFYLDAPYWAYNNTYDGQCWQPERVYTRTGWHWREVWVCP